ncbi:MAG: hypothetical protein GY820_08850 [Gammaproteobacteria bacterium]|nr:hypothetical protein [Gammaproteobacteria bacterium]
MSIRYFFLLLLVSLTARAQVDDPEWPCVQVLVPEIVPAVVWPHVINEALVGTWKQENSLVEMVNRLSDLDELTDSERQLIDDFIAAVPQASRADTLARLVDGIVELANRRRTRYIEGIKRYTRQQIAIANQIESTLNQRAELERQPDSQNIARQMEIEETLNWHQRVYDQREHAIRSLCEHPVELEEKLSRVLRELTRYLL